MPQQLTADQIRNELHSTLKQIRDDWNCSIDLTEQTGIFRDLGFESIDAIALGSALEERFNRSLPFAEFLTRIRAQKLDDISVGLLLSFLVDSLNGSVRREV